VQYALQVWDSALNGQNGIFLMLSLESLFFDDLDFPAHEGNP